MTRETLPKWSEPVLQNSMPISILNISVDRLLAISQLSYFLPAGKRPQRRSALKMNTPRTKHRFFITTLLIAASIALAAFYLLTLTTKFRTRVGQRQEEKQPAYWVAPMDPNYRRDRPGKSPMGMDLVPVYADGNPSNAARPEPSGYRRRSSTISACAPPSQRYAPCSPTLLLWGT